MYKRRLFQLIFIALFVMCFSFSVGAIQEYGICGDNIDYIYDSITKSIYIGGSGDMYGYDDVTYSPFVCSDIVSIEIEDGVSSIGNGAFFGCSTLESIIIPESVTSIGNNAFESCSSLSEIHFSDTVSDIGVRAFAGCESLTKIVFFKDITTISDFAFEYCVSLTDLIFIGNVESIEANTFKDCWNLSTIHVNSSVWDSSENIISKLPSNINIHYADYKETMKDCLVGEKEITLYCNVCDEEIIKYKISDKYSSHLFGQYVSDNNSSCLSYGTKTAECERCSKTDTVIDFDSSREHKWSSWQKISDETCVSEGVKTRSCLTCGETSTETISAISHINSYYVKEVAPTCTEKGYNSGEFCPDCKLWISGHETISSTGHSGGVATCNKKAICTKCNEPYGALDLSNHVNLSIRRGKTATCTEDGFTESKICIDCKAVTEKAEVIPAKGHTVVEIPGIGVTCTKDGASKGKKCSTCNTVIVEPQKIVAKGHKEVTIPGISPTCTKSGTGDSTVCSLCNCIIKKAATIPATGHNTVIVSGVAATCTKNGLTQGKKCLTCKTITVPQKTIPKNAHDYKTVIVKSATLTKNGKTVKECSCGAIKDKSQNIIYSPKTFALSTEKYTYNANIKNPAVTVKDSKGTVLKKDKDYSVKYESGRKTPGKYTVSIVFIGKYSGTKKLYFTIAPKATGKVTANRTTTSITLKWNMVIGADGYRVYKYNPDKKKYEKIADVNDRVLKVSGLSEGTYYKFKIKAYRKDSGTIWGKASDAYSFTTSPGKVQKATFTKTASSVNLKWKKVNGASGYAVYRYSSGEWKKIETINSGSKISYSINDLKSGTTYKFRIKAFIDNGTTILWGAASKTVAVTINPATPSLKSSSVKNGAVTLKWSNVSGENGYQLYYSAKKDSGFKKYTAFDADVTSLTINGLQDGNTYYFKIRSYKKVSGDVLYSSWSSVCEVNVR